VGPISAALLPRPPALGFAAEALDQEVAREDLALRDTPRWELAKMDVDLDLSFPFAAGVFSCALGTAITEQDTPRLYVMLRRLSVYTLEAWAIVR
jgi:acid phosphatase (class A)